jgi:hypothetical protein
MIDLCREFIIYLPEEGTLEGFDCVNKREGGFV